MENFVCAVCGATFETQDSRGEHYAAAHPDRANATASKLTPQDDHASLRGETAIAIGVVGLEATWKLVKVALVAFGALVIIGGFVYGRSDGFRTECAAHKVAGYDLGSLKNLICDVSFEIQP